MTKQCPECKRMLELNENNFRLSCDGYWRNKCRDCQNKHKRIKYVKMKATKTKELNPHIEVRQQCLQATISQYHKILKTLDRFGVSLDAPAEYVDKVLGNATKLSRKIA